MGTLDGEIDFPRVASTKASTSTAKGPSVKKAGLKRKNDNDTLFGDGTKKIKTGAKASKKEGKTAEKEHTKSSVWTKSMTIDMLIDGVMGVGVVREVHEDKVLLETSDSLRVNLPVTQVGKKFTELLKEEKISAEDVFTLGQMVPFRVTKRMVDGPKGKIYPTVSCDPAKLNAHLVPSRLVAGLVIHAIVESGEEKGYVLDIGLQSTKGFLPTDKISSAPKVGQPLVVRVESTTTRVVQVTSFVEQDNLSYDACEKLQLNHLMPGTIIECEPGQETGVAAGVYVSLGNGVRGFISRRHLPPRLRADTSRLSRAIRCVVMFCQQNTNILVLNAHPDIVAVSKPEKRIAFDGYDIGDRLNCTVMDVLPTKCIVTFSLPNTPDGKASLVTATSSKNYLNKAEECESFYTIGSEHQCRVMEVRYVERSLVVATRKDILKQKMVSYKDAVPGELVKARVTNINPKGVNVVINDTVKGFIPLHLISDKAFKLEKSFEVGKEYECRIFKVDSERKQVTVTTKQSLVEYSGAKISSYDVSLEGKSAMGTICNIFPTGALLVLFYNEVRGVLPAYEGKRLGANVKKDQSIEVRVMKVDPEEHKIQLALAEETAASSGGVTKPAASSINTKKSVFEGVISDVIEKNVAGKRLEKAEIDLESELGTASLSPTAASDMIEPPFDCFQGVLAAGHKLPHLALLGLVSGSNRMTSKWFVCEWLKNNKAPTKFDDIQEHMQVCGIVTQRSGENLFVEIAGGSGLLGRVAVNKHSQSLISDVQVGQTVVGHVVSINKEKRTFNVDLKLADNFGSERVHYSLTLAESFAREVTWFAENAGVPAPGSTVTASVSHIVDDIVFVVFNGKITGSLRKQNYSEGVKVGDKLNCVVLSYSYPNLDAELVQVAAAAKGKQKKATEAAAPRLVLVKKDYSVVLAKDALFFVANRLHPNISQSSRTLNVGDSVVLESEKKIAGSVNIALLQGDVDMLAKLNEPVSVAAKKTDAAKTTAEKPATTELKTKRLRNFKIYTATVVGTWKPEEVGGSNFCVKIKMPGGTFGRLHVSEFPLSYSEVEQDVVSAFLEERLDKQVNVKVIGFFSSKGDEKNRIAELTMNKIKLDDTRQKATKLSYQVKYKKGDVVECFMCPETDTTSANIRAEISPLVVGHVARESLSQEVLLKNKAKKGAVVDVAIPECARRRATVTGYSHMKGKIVLQLVLEEKENMASQETWKLGESVTGRVINIDKSKMTISILMSTGQQALLTPTAISTKYERVHKHLLQFNKGELFRLYALRRDEKPRRHYVITEGRYKQYQKDPESSEPTTLLPKWKDVKENVGRTVHGFLTFKSDHNTLVEIAPGITGSIRKQNKELAGAPLGSVVAVVINDVDADGRLTLKFGKIVFTPSEEVRAAAEKAAKKTSPKEEEADVKFAGEEVMKVDKGEKIKLNDPGFDWDNTGFTPEDLAAVGKLGSAAGADPSEENATTKKTKKEAKKESAIEKERSLAAKESAVAKGELLETDEDFDRLLRKDPNSAEAWIRYISFFVEKADLAKARATAERALTVINYREDAELFNIWTAYLNLEVAYGDAGTVKDVFQRACGNADSLKIHKQMAAILVANKKFEEADEIFNAMIRKFRASSDDVWYLYAEHLMSTERQQQGRDLLTRALASVPKARHPLLISRFAQLEYNLGDAERGRTLFESLVTAYSKKTDIWMVYADFALKSSGIETARQVLERACALPLNMHKLRPLFKKWMEFEEKHGDDQSRQLVRSQAQRYLQSQDMEE